MTRAEVAIINQTSDLPLQLQEEFGFTWSLFVINIPHQFKNVNTKKKVTNSSSTPAPFTVASKRRWHRLVTWASNEPDSGEGHHVIAVLPTGFGKSLIYQLLPDFVPERKAGNIVLVVSPLTSIIQDQLVNLSKVGIECGILQLEDQANSQRYEPLFEEDLNDASNSVFKISKSIVAGKCKILFAHPESLLSDQGRKILRSKIYEENVVACVIDEAHCVELWGEEFRTEFQNLSVFQAFFPHSIMLALTATASPTKLRNLKKALKIENCKVVTANPNRKSIFLKKK
ncbi:uncharacterized protein LOC130654739 [Hydractinia symbiolongicarpus]|uniref:uncharacterized protein LOC130654739 n=1 Tax=Hydractinia symbiolongicarpus TaxID=13093 RepID=UPI00254D24ED|nr:uncharacterized protein LOC130654739 [Hydractinia symbiolongicarpus]